MNEGKMDSGEWKVGVIEILLRSIFNSMSK